jgi:hypothetical protein
LPERERVSPFVLYKSSKCKFQEIAYYHYTSIHNRRSGGGEKNTKHPLNKFDAHKRKTISIETYFHSGYKNCRVPSSLKGRQYTAHRVLTGALEARLPAFAEKQVTQTIKHMIGMATLPFYIT